MESRVMRVVMMQISELVIVTLCLAFVHSCQESGKSTSLMIFPKQCIHSEISVTLSRQAGCP